MPIGNYTLDEIYVGDEVIFESNQVNTDFYWIVTFKDEKGNSVHVKTVPQATLQDTWIVPVKEIRVVLPISELRSQTGKA